MVDEAARRRCFSPGQKHEFVLPVDNVLRPVFREYGRRWQARFISHIAGMKFSVKVPLENIDSPRPAVGEKWRARGRFYESSTGRIYMQAFLNSNPRRSPADESFFDKCRIFYARLKCDLSWCCGVGLEDRERYAALNRSILLGDKSGMSAEERDAFRSSGTLHIFAVSGLHVMIVALAGGALLSFFVVNSSVRSIVLLPVLVLYVGVTGARPSAVRALAMLAMYFGADLAGRQRNALSALGITAFAMYAADPRLVFDVGATFSFTVMAAIAFGLETMRGVGPVFANRGYGAMTYFANVALASIGVGAIAWAAGVPVAANTFGIVTPVSILAGPLVMAFTAWQMSFAAAGMVAALVFEPAAAFFNNIAAAIMFVMMKICAFAAAVPFGHFNIGRFPPWAVALWYAAIIAIAIAVRQWLVRRALSGDFSLTKDLRPASSTR